MLITAAGLWMVGGAPRELDQMDGKTRDGAPCFWERSPAPGCDRRGIANQGRWLKRPSFMLILPLAVPPLGVLAAWLHPGWPHRGGAEIILTLA